MVDGIKIYTQHPSWEEIDAVKLISSLGPASFAPDSFSYETATNTVSITYNTLPEGNYTLTLLSAADAFRDVAGTPLDGSPSFPLPSGDGVAGGNFEVIFAADVSTSTYPLPLERELPPGSLIHDPVVTGHFHAVGDTDGFTLDLDAEQRVTVVLTPVASSTQGRLELFGPGGGSLGAAAASGAGETVVLQTAPAATAGTYRIEATSLAGTWRYQVQVILNAAAEEEELLGASNDTIGTAQDIEGSSVALQDGADRLAVVGTGGSDVEGKWYSISPGGDGEFTNLLREIDIADGSTIGSVGMSLAGRSIKGGNGLATHPLTGELWALLKLQGQSGGRELVTIDPRTGIATSIGNTGDRFSGIAFDSSGTLYGVTGRGANTPNTLFTLSTTNAAPTFVKTFGDTFNGKALTFNPVDGLLYRHSGRSTSANRGLRSRQPFHPHYDDFCLDRRPV